MRTTGERAGRNAARGVVMAVAAAATIFTMLPTATAAAPAPPAVVEHKALAGWEVSGDVGTQSTGSGSRSGDFTVDDVSDILARQANNGILKVYPHSGAFNGMATYLPSVTINTGWASMRWIGQGDMTGDGNPDVVYIDSNSIMWVAPHSGAFTGTSTLSAAVEIGTGWGINDLVTTGDLNADGFDDIMARRAGTDVTYVYLNNGGLNGFFTLASPQGILSGTASDIEQIFADFTLDGVVDMLFVQNNGVMGLYDPTVGTTYAVSYGWGGVNAFVATDVNNDGAMDILARLTSNGNLVAYRHSGVWRPTVDLTAFDTLTPGVVIGTNWHTNNVIT